MRTPSELRAVASQAGAELDSGVVKDPVDLGWLAGAQAGLLYASDTFTTAEMADLINRMSRVED